LSFGCKGVHGCPFTGMLYLLLHVGPEAHSSQPLTRSASLNLYHGVGWLFQLLVLYGFNSLGD